MTQFIQASVCSLFVAFAVGCMASISEAQEPAASDTQIAFQQSFNDYRAAVGDIEALRTEFQTADTARRKAINQELGDAVQAAKQKVNNMIDKAIAAYKAAPETDEQVTDLLVSVAGDLIKGVGPDSQGGDQYEKAYEVITALVEGGNQTKELPIWGLLSAFVTNEYDQAEKFVQMAIEKESFATPPDQNDEVGMQVFQQAAGYADMIDDYKKLWAEEQAIRAKEAEADDLPRVKFQTSKGDIVIELFENEAPTATANMVTLVKDGYYDGIVFHRVLPRFMAQGGDPTGTGSGGPGYSIACECYKENARRHFRGTLSMAHAGRDTGGSQFFLTFVPTSHLDGRHTVYGRVIEGMNVLGELNRINPGEQGLDPDRIIKAEVIRDRGHDYDFEKLPSR